MKAIFKAMLSTALAASVAGCAAYAGSMVGAGIAAAGGGDERAGALIGGGVGMMMAVMN